MSDRIEENVEIEEGASAKEDADKKRDKKIAKYKVVVPLLNVRERASLASDIVKTISLGNIVDISARTPQGFGKLADGSGYVKLEFTRPFVDERKEGEE